ncbi:hypothetical protein GF380_01775 [Candidatus Uhrbacteria bacterium]|nr:hypothetical protein [Candidatus Uhrbacteria bacterium]
MWRRLPTGFGVKRYGYPIQDVGVKGAVNTGITFDNYLYPLWDAAIDAGATLDELQSLDEYPKRFQAQLIAWHQIKKLINLHTEEARQKAADKRK